ncbi:MAG: hypothetical protein ACPGU1_11850 [Myxococcota bacterium]
MSLSILLMACGGGGGVSGGSSATGSEPSSDTASVDDVSGATETPEADGAAVEEPAVVAPLLLSCTEELECEGGLHCRSGVCLADPPVEEVLTLTDATGVDPYPAEVEASLGCMDEAPSTPDGPTETTLYGAVTRFGSGLITRDIRVEVFAADDWDPSECEAVEDVDARITCYAEYGSPEHTDTHGIEPLGSALSVAAEDAPESECDGHADCPLGYECVEDDVEKTCQEQFGLFEIAGVPTNTRLVIRSRATTYTDKWHDVYMFGVYLYADQVDASGRTHYDVTMVSEGQWLLTANIAGLTIAPENGVIGGRVRDCRVEGVCVDAGGAEGESCVLDSDCDSETGEETCSGGRASWPLGGVAIGLAQPAAQIVYFNNLEDDTVPLDFRTTTNILGRYAALDVPAGYNQIAGVARDDAEVVSVGGASVYVVPGALSIIGWPGHQPHWKQE